MKIILSRKGFDSSNGGCASPIMPDGTLLSMPIPSNDTDRYSDLCYKDESYENILSQINPRKSFSGCHIDPDIRENNRVNEPYGWKPAFGQCGAAQGLLSSATVEKGDIFLFFGWLRQTEIYKNKLRFVKRTPENFYGSADLHIIYGYMQIEKIITDPVEISEYYWHPHSSYDGKCIGTNALYIPSENLSFSPELKGYGTLDFRKDRVLTKENSNRALWNPLPFLMSEHVHGNRSNSAKCEGLYYGGIWQELVISESEGLLEWVKSIIL